MKKRERKLRNHFPNKAPMCRFGIIRGDFRPMEKPNPLCRSDVKTFSTSTPAVIKDVPVVKERILRWYTPEKFERWNGTYFHKRDRRYYPVVDTHHVNPFRRYKFYKTFYRKKRYYTTESRLEIKPYTRNVIDMISSELLHIEGESEHATLSIHDDLTWEVKPELLSKFDEVFYYTLALADELDPLVEVPVTGFGSDGELVQSSSIFVRKHQLESPTFARYEYLYPTRLEAFLASAGSTDDHSSDEDEMFSAYDEPPYIDRKQPLPFISTSQFIIEIGDDYKDVVTLRDINERLLALGLSPWRESSAESTSMIAIAGITGPSFVEKTIGHDWWLLFDQFDYSADWSYPLSQVIPFSSLTGTIGFHQFLQQPLRSTHLGQFLGEMPETVKSFADILSSAIKIAKQLKRGRIQDALRELELGKKYLTKGRLDAIDVAKAASSVDLFWKFGLKPFLDDLQQLRDLGSTFGDVTFKLGSKRRIRHNWSAMPWGKLPFITEFSSDFESSFEEFHVTGNSHMSLSLNCDVEYGAEIVVKDPIAFFFEALGLTDILGTAWELLPLSFVIDWFVDIGSVISDLTSVSLDSFDIRNGYLTFTTYGTLDETLTNIKVNGKLVDQTISNQYKLFEVNRGFFDPRASVQLSEDDDVSLTEKFVLLDLLKPTRDVILTPAKLGTLAELIIQRVRS